MTKRKRQSRKRKPSKNTLSERQQINIVYTLCILILGAALVYAIGMQDAPTDAALLTPVPTEFPRTPDTPTPAPITLYTTGRINARECPSASECPVLSAILAGTAVTGIARVEGENILGSAVWWRVRYDGDEIYIHSTLLADTTPIPPMPSPTVNPAAAPTRIPRPGNCSTAVAMGLTAQQAAQWSHLDRDDDGTACYGD